MQKYLLNISGHHKVEVAVHLSSVEGHNLYSSVKNAIGERQLK